MTINEYQKLAMTTLNKDIPQDQIIINACLGLSGEVGEVNDLIKKNMFQGHPLNKEDLINELGDIAWYLAEAATALNVDLEEILIKNIEKLKKRFPEGFTVENSINRK